MFVVLHGGPSDAPDLPPADYGRSAASTDRARRMPFVVHRVRSCPGWVAAPVRQPPVSRAVLWRCRESTPKAARPGVQSHNRYHATGAAAPDLSGPSSPWRCAGARYPASRDPRATVGAGRHSRHPFGRRRRARGSVATRLSASASAALEAPARAAGEIRRRAAPRMSPAGDAADRADRQTHGGGNRAHDARVVVSCPVLSCSVMSQA